MIKAWMQRDWAENLYPGATNAEGRRLLEEHLAAMFDLETEQPPLVELDGRLGDGGAEHDVGKAGFPQPPHHRRRR